MDLLSSSSRRRSTQVGDGEAEAQAHVVTGRQRPHLLSTPLHLGLEALKARYIRHVKAPAPARGEHTVQLSIIRKDSAPSGQEELRVESFTVTVKDGAEEPVATKPGVDQLLMCM